MVQTTV